MLGLQLATSEVKKIHNIGSTADQSCMAEEEVSVLETKSIEMIQSEEQREKKGKKWTEPQWPLREHPKICNWIARKRGEDGTEKSTWRNTGWNFPKSEENSIYRTKNHRKSQAGKTHPKPHLVWKAARKTWLWGENTNDCRLTTSNGGGEKAMKWPRSMGMAQA